MRQVVRDHRGSILTAAAGLGGWFFITLVLAALVSPWAWPASGGILLTGLAGFRTVARLIYFGVLGLTLEEDDG